MSSKTVELAIEKERAAQILAERASHIRQTTAPDAIEFRTNVGLHLATLTDGLTESGARGSTLRYRTSLIRPHLFHAHHKAREIRDALAEFNTTPKGR